MTGKRITSNHERDAGLALTLLLLLIAHIARRYDLILPAIGVLVFSMTWPRVFRPFAFFFFGLSRIMGNVVSRVLLAIIFFGIVTPVCLLRCWFGADPMRLKQWKANTTSAFIRRELPVTEEDLEKPY